MKTHKATYTLPKPLCPSRLVPVVRYIRDTAGPGVRMDFFSAPKKNEVSVVLVSAPTRLQARLGVARIQDFLTFNKYQEASR